jgi:hypothetical protein
MSPDFLRLRAEKLRISDFLEKPFSREIICNAVKTASGSAKRASELSQADSPVSAVQTHSISILPAFKDVIGTDGHYPEKRDRLAGRFRGRSRSRFRITDREMVPAADRKTLIYIVLAIEVSTFVLLANACLMLIIQILPK